MTRSILSRGGTTAPVNTQSTPGSGARVKAGGRGRGKGKRQLGPEHEDVFYLWVLLGLELAAMWILRGWSRNHHGG